MTDDLPLSLIMIDIAIFMAFAFWFFYGPWQEYCLDKARHEMFVVRDRLFDSALAGKTAFDNPDYIEARATINQMIRCCHYANGFHLFFLVRSQERASKVSVPNVMDIHDEAVKEAVRIFVKCMIKRSIFLVAGLVARVIIKKWYLHWVSQIEQVFAESKSLLNGLDELRSTNSTQSS